MLRPGKALADFTVNQRVFFISALALIVGLFASIIAVALIWLINVVTNLAFFFRFSAEASSPANSHLGLGLILVPVAGSLVIGLMARYGSEKIRGHGIPEALEAILLGRSAALVVGAIAALTVTVILMRRSILTEKIARRGHHISREYSVDLFQLLRVKEVMTKEPPSAPASMTVAELADLIAADVAPYAQRHGVPLVDAQGGLAGMITRADIMRALRNGKGEDTLLSAGSRDLVVTSPDELLSDAAAKMLQARIGRLPVVDPTDPTKLVGYLGR